MRRSAARADTPTVDIPPPTSAVTDPCADPGEGEVGFAAANPSVLAATEAFTCPDPARPEVLPDGQAQIAWVHFTGATRLTEVVAWRRMDRGPWSAGQQVEVTVQARSEPDLRLPLLTRTARLVLTLDPRDSATLTVGDHLDEHGWRYGLRFRGLRLAAADECSWPMAPGVSPGPDGAPTRATRPTWGP